MKTEHTPGPWTADLLACALAQEELATNSFDGDPQEAIIRVRNMRRAAISKATGAP